MTEQNLMLKARQLTEEEWAKVPKLHLELTRPELIALHSIVLDRAQDSHKGLAVIGTWVDVPTEQMVTIDQLLSIVTFQLAGYTPGATRSLIHGNDAGQLHHENALMNGEGNAPAPNQEEGQEADPKAVNSNGLGLSIGAEGEDQQADNQHGSRKPYVH